MEDDLSFGYNHYAAMTTLSLLLLFQAASLAPPTRPIPVQTRYGLLRLEGRIEKARTGANMVFVGAIKNEGTWYIQSVVLKISCPDGFSQNESFISLWNGRTQNFRRPTKATAPRDLSGCSATAPSLVAKDVLTAALEMVANEDNKPIPVGDRPAIKALIETNPEFVKRVLAQAKGGNSTVIRPDRSNAEDAQGFDFRELRWGMSKQEVRAREGIPSNDSPEEYIYMVKVGGLKAALSLGFLAGELYQGGYILAEEYSEKNLYEIRTRSWVEILKEKYGDPTTEERWINDLFRDDPKQRGTAISLGHLTVIHRWETARSSITFGLDGSNFKIESGVIFTSRAHATRADEAKRKAEKKQF